MIRKASLHANQIYPKMKTLSRVILSFILCLSIYPQAKASTRLKLEFLSETGDIKGTVLDDHKKPLAFANVVVLGTGSGASTNDDGSFIIHGINPGTYDIKASYLQMESVTKTGVSIRPNEITYVNFVLEPKKSLDSGVVIVGKKEAWQESPVHKDYSTYNTIPQKLYEELGSQSVNDKIMSVCSSCSMSSDNQLVMRGARSGSVEYIIDGQKVFGSTQVPNQAVEQLTVLSGGIPAEYGDLTGGVIIISTKDYVSGSYESRVMREKILANSASGE
jgi:hypothetical protein